MKLITFLFSLSIFSLSAQDNRKGEYRGSWLFSRYYVWNVLKIKRNNRVVFYHSGCLKQNIKKKGTWEYFSDSIQVCLENDTNTFYIRKKQLGSWLNDTLEITDSWVYHRTYFKRILGGVFHRDSTKPLSKWGLKRYIRRQKQ